MDRTVKICLLLIGLSLILGLFTRIGALGALFFLSLFYFLYVPLTGVPQPGNEGTYLIVNKTLIEAAAVMRPACFQHGHNCRAWICFCGGRKSKHQDSRSGEDERLGDGHGGFTSEQGWGAFLG